MERTTKITKFIASGAKGIEIGPWCSPLTPKSGGYDCLVMDVFDTDTLRARAKSDKTLSEEQIAKIEDVDIIGTSSQLAEQVSKLQPLASFDYIVSSHNLEHIPDLINFFQGCEKVLKDHGTLSMAIPDRRGCFDYFRPNSSSAEIIDAFRLRKDSPSPAQILEHCSFYAKQYIESVEYNGFNTGVNAENIEPCDDLREVYGAWLKRMSADDNIYLDVHCWTFTPASFEQIILDLNYLGLVNLTLFSVEAFRGEFYVHFRKLPTLPLSPEKFRKRRVELLRKANDEACLTSPKFQKLASEVEYLRSQLSSTNGKLSELVPKTVETTKINEDLKAVILAIKKSTSWKITAPLRAIVSFTRKITR